ncbi:hypothetical protein [Noviherbaspirillum sp.]|uniref:hypothetical protein n=1 Tax=Noviherbaspirillum sp. TaxID=1926288 RepID=UPI002FE0EC0B
MPNFTSWKTISDLKRFRVAKYKQRRQIKSRPLLATLPEVQIGGCTGLSFGWVQRYRKVPAEVAAKRIDYLNSDQGWRNIDYFAGFFNNLPAASYGERVDVVAPAAVGMRRRGTVTETNYATFGSALTHLYANPGFYIIIMNLKGMPTNHLCALYAHPDGMIFFDPNSGEYKVPRGRMLDFFLALVRQYATYVTSAGAKVPLSFREIQFHHLG